MYRVEAFCISGHIYSLKVMVMLALSYSEDNNAVAPGPAMNDHVIALTV